MKKFFFSIFLFAAILAMSVDNAFSGDSGDENIIPVYEWQCWACGKQYFTFQPDKIDVKTKKDFKDFQYQQKALVMLRDGSSIRKCEKMPDGAHFFDLKRELNTSPAVLMQRLDSYLALKEGGQTVKAKIDKVTCIGKDCSFTAYAFTGDDFDSYGAKYMDKDVEMFCIKDRSKIPSCRQKTYYKGSESEMGWHIFKRKSSEQKKSIDIASELRYFITSD